MRLSTSVKLSTIAAVAALAFAAPPFIGLASAQFYYPVPGPEMDVYPPPPDAVYPPPREVEEADPPRGEVNVFPPPGEDQVNPPPHEHAEINRPPHEVDTPAHQVSGTTTPTSAVSMRAGPGTDNPVIGTLHHGDQLQLLATTNHGWMQVQSPVGTGWVYGSYLASGAALPQPTNASAPGPMPMEGSNEPIVANSQASSGNERPPVVNNQPAPEIASP